MAVDGQPADLRSGLGLHGRRLVRAIGKVNPFRKPAKPAATNGTSKTPLRQD